VLKRFMPYPFLQDSGLISAGVYAFLFFPHLFGLLETNPHINFILLYEFGRLIFPYRPPAFQFVSFKLSNKLMKFWNQYQKQIKRVRVFLAFELDMAFCIPISIIELYKIYKSDAQYLPGLRTIVILVASPFVHRVSVSSINTGIQFICQNYVIQMKQNHYLSKLNDASDFGQSVRCVKGGYFRWCQIIGHVLDITREIKAMDKVYCKYVTDAILPSVNRGCTIIEAARKRGGAAPFLQVLPWYIFGCIYLGNLWLFSAFSSRTIYLNFELFKGLRRYQIQLLSRPYLTLSQIVKLDLVNEYKVLLQKCSFKMLNHSTINNKFFAFTLFVTVSIFWMKLETQQSFFDSID